MSFALERAHAHQILPKQERVAGDKILSRLELLKKFDPSNPATVLHRVEDLITTAFEEHREKDAYGWMGVLAMMREEVMRDTWLRLQKKRSAQAITEEQYGEVTGMYQGVLHHVREAPSEIIPSTPLRDLQRRLADVEANRKFYFLESLGAEEAKRAKQHLWSAFLLEPQEGKRAEIALVGILRYGLNYFRAPRVPEKAPSSAEERFLDPVVYVQGTMPREDIEHVGKFPDTDLFLMLPGDTEPVALQLKTGSPSTFMSRSSVYRLAVVNLAASRLMECWRKIGDPSHEMSEAEFRDWKNLYREVVESLTAEIAHVAEDRAARIEKFFLPWQRSPSARRMEMPELALDQALSLHQIQTHWPQMLSLRPELEHEIGSIINLSNFSRAKAVIKTWVNQEQDLPLWQGWIRSTGTSGPHRLRRASAGIRGQ